MDRTNLNSGKYPVYGLEVTSSLSTVPIPLVWGVNRIAANLGWYGDFKSGLSDPSSSGKGGGGKNSGSDYSASWIGFLCEGGESGILAVGAIITSDGGGESLNEPSSLGIGIHTGSMSQAPWGYLTANHPNAALAYPGVAYAAAENYFLKGSPAMPNLGYIVGGLQTYTGQAGVTGSGATVNLTQSNGVITGASPGSVGSGYSAAAAPYVYIADNNGTGGGAVIVPNVAGDGTIPSYTIQQGGQGYIQPRGTVSYTREANMALVIEDFLSNPIYGAGLGQTLVNFSNLLSGPAAGTTGDNSLETYCRALGLFMSPALTSQESATSTLQRWLRYLNCVAFCSGTDVVFAPRGDQSVSGNGVIYIPDVASVRDFNDDDYIAQGDTEPVRTGIADCTESYNIVRLEIRDGAGKFNPKLIQVNDNPAEEVFGVRPDSSETAHEFTDSIAAALSAQLLLQRGLYIRNTYEITVSWHDCNLDPMDPATLTDINLGLAAELVRITGIEEGDDDNLTISFEELPIGVATAEIYDQQVAAGTQPSANLAPDSTNTPIIFEPNQALLAALGQSPQPAIALAVSGGSGNVADPNWGGCDVLVSDDDESYAQLGTVTGPARMGVLLEPLPSYTGANPDMTYTLVVDLGESGGTLASASTTDASSFRSLCYVDGEFLAFTTATLIAGNQYSLTGLYRGLYGSGAGAHATGAAFARVDDRIESIALPPQYVGVPLWIKLPSFNLIGQQAQDPSMLEAYTYTPTGAGQPLGPVFSLLAAGVSLDFGLCSRSVSISDDAGSCSTPAMYVIDLGDCSDG
jgi:hypothetical protein